MNKKNKYLTIRIDDDLLNQLKTQADNVRRKLSDFVYLILLDASTNIYADTHKTAPIEKPRFKITED